MMKKIYEKRNLLFIAIILTLAITILIFSTFLNALENQAEASRELQVFKDALTIIKQNYVKDIQPEELLNAAIQGMIAPVDSNSNIMKAEQCFKVQLDKKEAFIKRLISIVEIEDSNPKEVRIFKDALTLIRKKYDREVRPKELVYSAIRGMTESLDPHSDFLTPQQYIEMKIESEGEFGGVGIKLEKKDGEIFVIDVLDNSSAFKAGLKKGDKIIKIDNELTKNMGLQDVVQKIRGTPSTMIRITIIRQGWKETRDFILSRELVQTKSVESKMLKDSIGYIKIHQFQKQTASSFSSALSNLMQENMKSLILDLRDNPGGLLYSGVDVASNFIPFGKVIVYTKDKRGKLTEYKSHNNNPYLTIPIVVIVNEGSASASEIVAGALKDWNRATIIGTTTYGKGSVQTVVPLKDGSALILTTKTYFTPKGISIQATGISPDIVIKPRIKKGQQVYLVIREKDLEGHFVNGKSEGTGVSKVMSPTKIDVKEDVQLQSAINYLKSKIYKDSEFNYSTKIFQKAFVSQIGADRNV